MKKIILYVVFIFLFAISTSALWDTNDAELGRTMSFTNTLDLDFEVGLLHVNFTCGTGGGDAYIQPMFGEFDTTSGNDMIVLCSGDTDNPKTRLIFLDQDLVVKDTQTIDGEWGDSNMYGSAATYLMPYDVENIDSDANYEIILYHPTDSTGGKSIELIIYEYNTSTEQFTKERHIVLANVSTNFTHPTITTNIVAGGTNTELDKHIECFGESSSYGGACYIFELNKVIAFNVTDDTFLWHTNLSWYLHTGIINSGNTRFIPIFRDNDADNIIEMSLMSSNSESYVSIDLNNGSIDNFYNLTVEGTSSTWNMQSCQMGKCPDPTTEGLVTLVGSISGGGYCSLYNSLDGQLIQENDVGGSNIGAIHCWLEDRDSDGNTEICGLGFADGSETSNQIRCEEITFVQQETVNHAVLTNGSYNEDIQGVMVDLNLDGFKEFVGKGIYDFEHSYDYRELLLDDISGEIDLITIVQSYTDSSSVDIIQIPQSATLDTWFITAQTIEGIEVPNNKATFNGNGPYQQLANPVCSNETLFWTCSYSDNCISDEENDKAFIMVDCDSNGTFEYDPGRSSYFPMNDFTNGCDMVDITSESVNNRTGLFNATFVLYDEEHNQSENNTYLVEYNVQNESCRNIDDPGNIESSITNTAPIWIGLPESQERLPYCLNDSIAYSVVGSWFDADNDTVYFRIDCEGDGEFEKLASYGTSHFVCDFNDTSVTNINVEVCDSANNDDCAGISLSVLVNETICYNESSVDEFREGLNSFHRFFYDLGKATNIPTSMIGLVLAFFLGVFGFFNSLRTKAKHGNNPWTAGLGLFAGAFMILVFTQVISIFVFLAVALLSILVIVMKVK